MKQKRLVSMVGALVLTISAVVLITGCPQANGGISTKSIVEFDSTSVKCKKINSYPYTDVTSGSQIQEKDEFLFEAILSSDKIVENWYINDFKQEHKTNSVMSYRVEASDIIGGNLKVRFTTKNPVKGNIEFDTASIKCKKTNSSPYTDVTNESQIQEKDELLFEAILSSDKIVENWYINDVKQEHKTNSVMSYRVEVSDIISGNLKVRFTTKNPVKGNIEFDTASIKCKKTNSYPYTDVTSGSQIQEKDKLMFEAILPTGKVVENWYINDVKQEYETNARMSYRVEASDIVDGKIKIRVVFK